MAIVMRLADEGTATTYDLYGGTLRYLHGTWQPGLLEENRETVIDTLRLVGRKDSSGTASGTATDAQFITAEDEILDLAQRAADWWLDPYRHDSIWFEYNAGAETAKRTLVHRMTLTPVTVGPFTPLLGRDAVFYDMTIEHAPFWEARIQHQLIGLAGARASLGGTVSVAETGNLGARIGKCIVSTNAGDGPLEEVWIGVRPARKGWSAFVPTLELEAGTALTDASVQAEAASSDGAAMRVVFSTASLAQRCSTRLDDHLASDYDHMIGSYNVLARCKVTGGTVGLQLRHGYASQNTMAANEEVYDITHTNYKLVDLGRVTIPPGSYRALVSENLVNYFQQFTFSLWAEEINGATGGTLWLDALTLIPAEHQFHANNCSIAYGSALYILTHENDQTEAVQLNDGVPTLVPAISAVDWQLPAGSAFLVIAAQRGTAHILDDVTTMELDAYRRWRHHYA